MSSRSKQEIMVEICRGENEAVKNDADVSTSREAEELESDEEEGVKKDAGVGAEEPPADCKVGGANPAKDAAIPAETLALPPELFDACCG